MSKRVKICWVIYYEPMRRSHKALTDVFFLCLYVFVIQSQWVLSQHQNHQTQKGDYKTRCWILSNNFGLYFATLRINRCQQNVTSIALQMTWMYFFSDDLMEPRITESSSVDTNMNDMFSGGTEVTFSPVHKTKLVSTIVSFFMRLRQVNFIHLMASLIEK